jgi:hypothetical protein
MDLKRGQDQNRMTLNLKMDKRWGAGQMFLLSIHLGKEEDSLFLERSGSCRLIENIFFLRTSSDLADNHFILFPVKLFPL